MVGADSKPPFNAQRTLAVRHSLLGNGFHLPSVMAVLLLAVQLAPLQACPPASRTPLRQPSAPAYRTQNLTGNMF